MSTKRFNSNPLRTVQQRSRYRNVVTENRMATTTKYLPKNKREKIFTNKLFFFGCRVSYEALRESPQRTVRIPLRAIRQ